MIRLIPAACLLALLTGLAGCNSRKVSVSGTVTRGGEQLTWPEEDGAPKGMLTVIFVPENAERNLDRYPAETDIKTNTYKIAAIPPGKYTVAVQLFDQESGPLMDALGGAYDPGHTTLTAVVTHDGQVIDVDIPAPEGRGGGGGGGFRKGGGKGKGGKGPPAEQGGEPAKGGPDKGDMKD
jgi:hypothetical protein